MWQTHCVSCWGVESFLITLWHTSPRSVTDASPRAERVGVLCCGSNAGWDHKKTCELLMFHVYDDVKRRKLNAEVSVTATTGMWHHLDVFLMWQHSFHFVVSDFRWCSPPLPPGHVTPQFKRWAMNVSQVRLTWFDYTWVCGQVSLRRRTCVRHMSAGTLQTHTSWCRCKNHWCLEMLSWIWYKPSAVFIFVSFSIFCNRIK